jgi:hypothetical protein
MEPKFLNPAPKWDGLGWVPLKSTPFWDGLGCPGRGRGGGFADLGPSIAAIAAALSG